MMNNDKITANLKFTPPTTPIVIKPNKRANS